jgi:hypothetical protein
MITATGYSKDPNIVPEGIAVTFGKDMMLEQGGIRNFLKHFEDWMTKGDDHWWLHRCKNKPQVELDYVYVIVLNRLYCRCYYGGYEKHETIGGTADGGEKEISWPRIILAGPIEKPNFKRRLQGFQGFRYCTKLF